MASYKSAFMKEKFYRRTVKYTVITANVFNMEKTAMETETFKIEYEIPDAVEQLMFLRAFKETENKRILNVISAEIIKEPRMITMAQFMEMSVPVRDGVEIETE